MQFVINVSLVVSYFTVCIPNLLRLFVPRPFKNSHTILKNPPHVRDKDDYAVPPVGLQFKAQLLVVLLSYQILSVHPSLDPQRFHMLQLTLQHFQTRVDHVEISLHGGRQPKSPRTIGACGFVTYRCGYESMTLQMW